MQRLPGFAVIRLNTRSLRLLMWTVLEGGVRNNVVGRGLGRLIRDGVRGGGLVVVVGAEDAL